MDRRVSGRPNVRRKTVAEHVMAVSLRQALGHELFIMGVSTNLKTKKSIANRHRP